MRFAPQMLSKYYADITPTTAILVISAHILDSFQKLRSSRKSDKAMHIIPEDNTSYTSQYQEALLKYVENEYCAKHRRMSVMKPENVPSSNLCLSAKSSGIVHSSFDPYDLSSNDEEHLMPEDVAEMTPG